MSPVHLGPLDLAAAAILLVADGALSLVMRLGVARQLAVAATRMVVQLLLVGAVLTRVFAAGSPALTLAVIAAMTAIAAREVAARPRQRLTRHGNAVIGGLAVAGATSVASVLALTTALRPQPWYDPRYMIPLAGIVLGSVLNASSVALDSLLGGVMRERPAIEARLALGTTMRRAIAPLARNSIRRGLLPVVNQMSAAGVITLPGIMTGQILAGMDPIDAVKYQILLMLLLSGASGLAAFATVSLGVRRLTDARDRLRLDRLRT